MISRNDLDTGNPETDEPEPRQRSPRTDPDMRDGDSGRGNPLEAGPTETTTDNDVGDTSPRAGEMEAEIDRAREQVVESGGGPRDSSGSMSPPSPDPADRPAEGGGPLADYGNLTVPEIIRQTSSLPIDRAREVRDYEKSHRRRKTLLTKLERMLRKPEGRGGDSGTDNPPPM